MGLADERVDVRARPVDGGLDRGADPLSGTVRGGHEEEGHRSAEQERDGDAGAEPDGAPRADRGEPFEERVQPADAMRDDPVLDVTVETEQRLGGYAPHD